MPKNRDNNGTLKLYQCYDYNDTEKWIQKHSCPCKGKGSYKTDSPDSWKYENGNTPLGGLLLLYLFPYAITPSFVLYLYNEAKQYFGTIILKFYLIVLTVYFFNIKTFLYNEKLIKGSFEQLKNKI